MDRDAIWRKIATLAEKLRIPGDPHEGGPARMAATQAGVFGVKVVAVRLFAHVVREHANAKRALLLASRSRDKASTRGIVHADAGTRAHKLTMRRMIIADRLAQQDDDLAELQAEVIDWTALRDVLDVLLRTSSEAKEVLRQQTDLLSLDRIGSNQ